MNILNNSIVKILPLVPRGIVRKFANKYIAGDVLSDAVEKAKKLNDMGIMGTMDVLGENTTNELEAGQASRECIDVLEAIDKNKLDSNLSIKLTQFGLNLDMDLCFENVSKVLDAAKSFKQFVRIDMEDSSVTSKTIEMFERARAYYPACGIAIQAYMRRTYIDAERLIKSHTNFRLCKGIYVEPEKVAFKKKEEVNDNYLKTLRLMLSNGSYVGIATHDDQLINGAYQMLDEMKKKKDEYEFQMLLGVRENLRDKILKDGHRIRVYIPFGKHWYNYSIRRFKENPQMAGYIFKSLFSNN
jgi:proline dehydrogenase